ncbi:hypothetical protein [Kocuria kalidii]|uniref:hypothetical protein n=1 Tax=Kocuria kalidii TaxID=3376283 RepID=UPI0037AAA3C2
MRKTLILIPATLFLASCGANAEEPQAVPQPETVTEEPQVIGPPPEPTEPPSEEVPSEFPMDMTEMDEPPKPGPNTVTITATSASDGTAHWGDIGSGNVTDIPAGTTWSETFEGVDASDHWTVTVMGDFVSRDGDVSCAIEVDGEVVDEVSATGTGASAFCSSTEY